MQLPIIKCHGSGNDFALLDQRVPTLAPALLPRLAQTLSDRAGPVGGDGILVLGPGDARHAFAMRILNRDGSEAETCLNGLRCVARLGFERLDCAAADVRLMTSSARVTRAAALAPGVYTVTETVGPVGRDPRGWLTVAAAEWTERPVPGLPSTSAFTALAMPNPHLIAFVERIDDAELAALGAWAEAAPPLLPARANVSFAERRGPAELFVRTAERGVGLTDACGSAMAAATFAAALTGRCGFDVPVTVLNRGGRVRARASADGTTALDGNATFEWEGSVAVDPATGAIGAPTVTRRFPGEIAAWARVAAQTA